MNIIALYKAKNIRRSCYVSIAALVFLLVEPSAGADPQVHLRNAAEAYTRRDWLLLSNEVKAAVAEAPEDPEVLQAASQIQDQAYTQLGSQSTLPADFHLPAEITRLNIGLVRNLRRGAVTYRYAFQGSERTRGFIRDLSLERLGSQGAVTMLDRTRGEWEYERLSPGEDPEFGLFGDALNSPPNPGLYRVTVTTTTGVSQGTVLITPRDISSASFSIDSPVENEVLQTATPTFQVQNLVTPEFRETDKRRVWIAAYALDPKRTQGEPTEVWSIGVDLKNNFNTPLSVTVGALGGSGVSRLQPGNYMLRAKFTEQRLYGDLRISRNTGRNLNFSVR